MRDFQRTKFWKAWSHWQTEIGLQPKYYLPELQDLAEEIVPDHPIRVLWVNQKSVPRVQEFRIRKNLEERRDISELLWNIAHFRTSGRTNWVHSPAFCRKLIALVKEHMGPSQASALVQSFMKHKLVVTEAQEIRYEKQKMKKVERERRERALLLVLEDENQWTNTDHKKFFEHLMKLDPEVLMKHWDTPYFDIMKFKWPERHAQLRQKVDESLRVN